jgi:hypothetical protein
MIKLIAPKIAADQRKKLTVHKAHIEGAIAEVEGDFAKVKQLRAKQKTLEKEALTLHRDAANFHKDAELKLLLNQKTLERLFDAVHKAESECHDCKLPLFRATDDAQELVSKICQATYNELLDQIAAAISPYYRSFNDAREGVARYAHAVNDLVHGLLAHRTNAADSIEGLFKAAKDTLRKVDALLTQSEIWSYQGGASTPAESTEAAAA